MSSPVEVTHFFSLNTPEARPVATEAALVDLGVRDIVTDEELTGDGHWHLAAFDSLLLLPRRSSGVKSRCTVWPGPPMSVTRTGRSRLPWARSAFYSVCRSKTRPRDADQRIHTREERGLPAADPFAVQL